MINYGRYKCEHLKKIRQMIADQNGIDYKTTECKFQGSCSGTCPKCEAELRYLEQELERKMSQGRKVAVAGIALGLSMITACSPSKTNENIYTLEGEIFPDSTLTLISEIDSIEASDTTAKDNAASCQLKTKKGKTAKPKLYEEYIEPLEGDVVAVDDVLAFVDTIPDIEDPIEGEVVIPDIEGDMDQEEDPVVEEPEVYSIVEEMPEFTGGELGLRKYITENIRYPEKAKENGIQGTVYIRFIVDRQGMVTNVEVMRGIDPLLDNEAVRVVQSLPEWKPGKQRGQIVKVSWWVPVKFSLDNSTKNN